MVDEVDDEVNEDDKDTDADDVEVGVAVEEVIGVDEVGITEVVVAEVGADVVDAAVDAGDVRPPYVQSEFNGI